MSIFNQIIILSKKIAASLLKDEKPIDLDESQIFSDEDKEYIIKNITDESSIIDRLNLANRINKDEDWKTVKSKIDIPVIKLWHYKYAAAAILVVALASTYFLRDSIFNNQTENTTPVIVNNKIEKGTDKATLTLEDGSTVILEKGTAYQTQNANSNGEQIVYLPTGQAGQQQSSSRAQLRDNTLTIPRGGQFFAQLSDGTKVWLNSESQLKYPVAFVAGETRRVELVYGEAYFEVSPSTEHKGANFKVFNNNQEVEVLGTEFNIKAYKAAETIHTTLVKGKVSITAGNQVQVLKPGERSDLDLMAGTIMVSKADVFRETAWKQGVFNFKDLPLNEIMETLARWYDMEIVFENADLKNARFVGTFYKHQSIEEIMMNIKNTHVVKNYEIHEKTLVLR